MTWVAGNYFLTDSLSLKAPRDDARKGEVVPRTNTKILYPVWGLFLLFVFWGETLLFLKGLEGQKGGASHKHSRHIPGLGDEAQSAKPAAEVIQVLPAQELTMPGTGSLLDHSWGATPPGDTPGQKEVG